MDLSCLLVPKEGPVILEEGKCRLRRRLATGLPERGNVPETLKCAREARVKGPHVCVQAQT